MAECPNSIEELEALEKLIPLCREEILKQVEARKEAGTATSDRDAARQLAEETGRTEEGIRTAVKRARKVGSVNPPEKTAKSPSDLELLDRKLKDLKVDLQQLVKRDKSNFSDDETKCYDRIKRKGEAIIRLFTRLGIDVERAWNSIGGKNWVQREVIDVEAEVISQEEWRENGEETIETKGAVVD